MSDFSKEKREQATLNLIDSLAIYKELSRNKNFFERNHSSSNLISRWRKSLLIIFKRLVTSFYDDEDTDLRKALILSKTILYVNSFNTFKTLAFLSDISRCIFAIHTNEITPIKRQNRIKYSNLPVFKIRHRISILPWFLMIVNYPRAVKRDHFFLEYPDLYFENWWKDQFNIKLFKELEIEHVFFANDHNVENRQLLNACRYLGIKTIFLQHASATPKFPRLSFDLSFLYGEKDFHTYQGSGKSLGKVYLVGSQKFDELFDLRKERSSTVNSVGISVNLTDKLASVERLVNEIYERTDLKIIVRFHPRDTREFSQVPDTVQIQRGDSVSLKRYLNNISVHVAGNSSIHIEALYSGIPSLYFYSDEKVQKDVYKFTKWLEIPEFSISNLLNSRVGFTYRKLKPVIASVDESFDGHVSTEIKNIIKRELGVF